MKKHNRCIRACFQGSNIRTKTGRSPIEVFEDTANSPASLLAIRCALALAILRKWQATIRDAEKAYLQARIDVDPAVVTLVELPKPWWPDSWFSDASRTKPLFRRPLVRLIKCLYGHPKAGKLWEEHFDKCAQECGKVEGWPGMFIHDMRILIVYVHWTNLGR